MSGQQPVREGQVPPERRRRWIGRLVGAVSSLVLTLFMMTGVALFFLVATEDGLRLGFQVLRTMLPAGVSIAQVEGRLTGPLTLHRFGYRDQSLDLEIARIRLEWRPRELFRGKLSIQLLEVEAVEVITFGAEESAAEPDAPIQLPEIVLPLGLDLELARIDGARLAAADSAAPVQIELLELGASFTGSTLALRHLQLDMPELSLRSQGQVQLEGHYPLRLSLDWVFRGLSGTPIEGRGELSGDLGRSLTLQQTLDQALRARLSLAVTRPLDRPSVDAELHLEHLNPAELDPQWPRMSLSGEMTLAGGLEALRLSGTLTGSAEEYGRLENRFDLSWANGAIVLEQLEAKADNGMSLRANARWEPGEDGLVEAEGDWAGLVWPPAGTPEWQSPNGHFQVSGKPADYRFQLEARARGPGLPDTALTVGGQGGLERARLERIGIDTLEGRITGQGQVSWAPQIDWELGIAAQGINPGVQWPEWPGKIDGQAATRGAIVDSRPTASLEIPSISGELRGFPVVLKGRLEMAGDAVEVGGLSLASGSSRLDAQGRLADRWDLEWSLHSDDLGSLLPQAGGKISASGRLKGARNQPGVKATLSGGGLSYQGYKLSALTGEVDFRPQGGDRIHLQLVADDLDLGQGNRWRKIRIDGGGTLPAHQLSLSAEGEPARLAAKLAAGLDDNNLWQGRLNALDLSSRDLGDWQLEAPVPFLLSAAKVDLKQGCLRSAEARACVTAARVDSAFKGSARLERVALDRLKPWLPPGIEIQGMANADTRFDLNEKGALLAAAELTIPRGQANLQLGDESRVVDFSGSFFRLNTDAAGLTAGMELPLNRNGGVEGSLQLPGWTLQRPSDPAQLLKGRLKARMDDLELFTGLVQGVSGLRGRLDMDMNLSGSFGRPGLRGYARLQEGAVDYLPLGISLRQIELEAVNRGLDELVYKGGLVAGEGSLTLDGSTRFDVEGVLTKLSIKGENLTVADIPEAWLLLSPDLQIGLDSRRVEVAGEVKIPRARIRPREIPESAVASSPDVRFADQAGQEAAPPVEVHASVRVKMGEQVSFDGFGLRGLIRGNLLVIDEPGKPTLGSGQLSVDSGTYRAYGQELEIRSGRAIFANSLVTNPGIAVTAVRTVGDVEAGVNVTGTLKKPLLRIFSSPAMAQSEALSYLLLGRSSGRTASDDERASMSSAASALAAGGGGLLAAEIGRQFGLDDLSLQSSGKNDELALQLGVYLSPRLYIQYITELSTARNQVKMRYDLTERIQVETETGTVHGGDIFYIIER